MSESCVNTMDGECVFPVGSFGIYLKRQIRTEVLSAFKILQGETPSVGSKPMISEMLQKGSNEQHKKFYYKMREIMALPKTDRGCGYCIDCAGKALEFFIGFRY